MRKNVVCRYSCILYIESQYFKWTFLNRKHIGMLFNDYSRSLRFTKCIKYIFIFASITIKKSSNFSHHKTKAISYVGGHYDGSLRPLNQYWD